MVTSDAELSRGWAQGDQQSYDGIVARYAPMVHARCRRALTVSDADDATQAVFLVLARRGERAAASPALVAWLLRVTENVVRNAVRDRARRSRAETLAGQESSMSSVDPAEGDTAMPAIRCHLDAALAKLPAHEREAIILHYLVGHSLAEVAELNAAGVSTIKDRLQRGLMKLRNRLQRSGSALSLAALADHLQRCTPPLHAAHIARLQHLPHLPPTAIPPHVARWSRPGISMKTVVGSALACTVVLFGSVALYTLHGADAGAGALATVTPADPAPNVTDKQAPAPAFPPLDDAQIDPERARGWTTAQWHDGRRTAQRLQSLPELELLPDHGKALLDGIAGMRAVTLTMSMDDVMMPRQAVIDQYRLRHDLAGLNPEGRFQRAVASSQATIAMMKAARGKVVPVFPLVHGKFTAAAPDAAALTWLQEQIDHAKDGLGPLVQVLAGSVSSIDGATMTLDTMASATAVSPVPPAAATGHAECDLAIDMLVNPGNGHFMTTGGLQFTVTTDGLHLTMDSPGNGVGSVTPKVDRARLDTIPGDALLAAQVALTPASTATSLTLHNVVSGMRMGQVFGPQSPEQTRKLAVIDGIYAALKRVDGQVQWYLEPGAPVPLMTLVADLPQAAWIDLRTAIGSPVADDGSVIVTLGMVQLSIGWQDGHLLMTTNPEGLSAVTFTGGFTTQPEIRKALAAMPAGDSQIIALLRPEAFAAAVGPFSGMVAPQISRQLPAYEQSLHMQTAYGYLMIAPAAGATHVEASGLLSLAAAAVLASQLAAPSGAN